MQPPSPQHSPPHLLHTPIVVSLRQIHFSALFLYLSHTPLPPTSPLLLSNIHPPSAITTTTTTSTPKKNKREAVEKREKRRAANKKIRNTGEKERACSPFAWLPALTQCTNPAGNRHVHANKPNQSEKRMSAHQRVRHAHVVTGVERWGNRRRENSVGEFTLREEAMVVGPFSFASALSLSFLRLLQRHQQRHPPTLLLRFPRPTHFRHTPLAAERICKHAVLPYVYVCPCIALRLPSSAAALNSTALPLSLSLSLTHTHGAAVSCCLR